MSWTVNYTNLGCPSVEIRVTDHTVILFATSEICLHRDADLPNGLMKRLALTLQHLNLPQPQNGAIRPLSLPRHLRVLRKMGSHYPSWWTILVDAIQLNSGLDILVTHLATFAGNYLDIDSWHGNNIS